ncbi:MAG: hypothetical protein LBJ90_01035 [Treponema sp.]|jgi:hypothetical protein|nr:hypothetical protein [Treponema sp.]
MVSEKKPSIYSDRGTIGSSDELDEYGVWVKSEPQELSSAGAESQESVDVSLSGIEELPDFDAGFDEELSGIGNISESDQDEISHFDALDLPDLDIPDDSLAVGEEIGDFTESGEDLSGDEEEFDASSFPEDSSASVDAEGFTEIPMEDFLEENLKEEEIPEKFEDPSPRAESGSEGTSANTAGQTDLSTHLLMKIAEELSSIRTELSALKKEFAVVKTDAAVEEKGEPQQHGGFFDEEEDEKIALTGDELDNILNTADFTEEAGADATEELQGEYSSDDTPSALDPFQDLTADASVSDPLQFIDESALPDLDADSSAGMLSDKDDIIGPESEDRNTPDIDIVDTNIVIDDTLGIGLRLDEPELEMPSGEEAGGADLPGEDDISFEAGDLDEAALVPDAEITFDESKDSEALKKLRLEGAQPMTPAPEDTSYLEEDAGESENIFDENSIDLSQAVIDEPDLSGEITENPLQEPSLDDISLEGEDISIDLDMEDTEEDEKADDQSLDSPAPAEEEELEFSIPDDAASSDTEGEKSFPASSGEEDNFAQVIPEGFVVEADESQIPFEDDMEGEESFGEEDLANDLTVDLTAGPGESADAAESVPDAGEEAPSEEDLNIPSGIKSELKTVLSYMDQLLESLPEEKIEEFAKSEYFDTYKKLFKELGLV